ncbi:MAG: hypothetical protein ACRDRV_21270 [Pseudonocardiaceae bacterium]
MFWMVPRLLVAVGVVAAVVTTTGCAADKAEACQNIDQEIQALFRTAPRQAHDKPVLARTLHAAAGKIRAEGGPVGGDVEEASENAAVALDHVAGRVIKGEAQKSDLELLLDAGTRLNQVCR